MAKLDHPLHSMSTYLGGFPPRVPRQIIHSIVRARTTVLDPFCGSGTTLLESKLAGHPSIGVDLNPLAVALSRAKIQPVSLDDLDYRLVDLGRNFSGASAIHDVPDILRVIYHDRTLAQLCYLKDKLGNSPEDLFIRGCILGVMHGRGRQNGGTAYLSVDMPNTFSMSPNYVRQFVERHNLKRPLVDVFAKLRERARRLLRKGAVPTQPPAHVIQGDATKLSELLEDHKIVSVGAIVTSPPYLGVLRYGAFNWIRLWFLGFDQYQIDSLLDGTDSLDVYLSFMASFLHSAARVVRPGAVVVIVVGDVLENGQHVPLANRIWEELCGVVPFRLVDLHLDHYDVSTKTTRIWGDDRKGRATPMDRTLVLERVSRMSHQSRPTKSERRRHAPSAKSAAVARRR